MKSKNMIRVDCYFDYISPFSYLLHEQLHRLPENTSVNYIPVLFAGLLKHWGTIGPVDIAAKKTYTYRHCTWLAQQLDIPFRMPDSHPFIPLPYLRLTIAKSNDEELITQIFRAIWVSGHDPATDAGRQAIWNEIDVTDADNLSTSTKVKQALFDNTRQAIEHGVFGVPTLIVDGELFWGLDSMNFLSDYLSDRDLFERSEMKRLENISSGID
ncbi:MAG: 2-hydroxychromene-2-carboxylate isomerase [Acidiferrobacterales bacterium]|nr:2-hydroxychromene-2-carboxylate isomerase [Acidiferrobacterales bacterium]